LIQAVINAFDNETRQRIMAHLYEAGDKGLRASEVSRLAGEKPDTTRKALQILEQALLVQNQVGRDRGGVFSRYVITQFGSDWFEKMELVEGKRALPLLLE
jgi:predicted transcriptional regulator